MGQAIEHELPLVIHRSAAVAELEQATRHYIRVRASSQLPRNKGVRKGTIKRNLTADRLAEARQAFWKAWFQLEECKGEGGTGWTQWLEVFQPEVVRHEEHWRVLWPEEDWT